MKYVFFGTPHIARLSLEALEQRDMLPELIVTAPARPQGRGMMVTETPVAAFAREHGIPCIMPEKITSDVIALLQAAGMWDFFFVVAYGKILPQSLLDIVDGRVLNLHPSLLPQYRGPSPLESVLLSSDTITGVSIMELDKEIDHGPIVIQQGFPLPIDMTVEELTEQSAILGVQLFAESIEGYLDGTIPPILQDHAKATHTRKYSKPDGNIDEVDTDLEKWNIFRALGERGWVHFSAIKQVHTITVKIIKASYNNSPEDEKKFIIEEVIPENGKRQSYDSFLQSLH
jgi:methionyl-tRNA formyltransferase